MHTSMYGNHFIKSSKKKPFDDEWGGSPKTKSKDKKKSKEQQRKRDEKRQWEQPE